jgi:hypothetical protein
VKNTRKDGWGILALSVLIMSGALIAFMVRSNHVYTGPEGRVTDRFWSEEFRENGELLYPERWCLILDNRDEVCVPKKIYDKLPVGSWMGEQK